MARFTSSKWALVKGERVTNSAADSQTLFLETGLRTPNGKLSLKQAMYKMEDWYNEGYQLMSIGKDGNVYRFDRLHDIGKGQTDYNVVALRDTDPCFWAMKDHFKDGSTPSPTQPTKTEKQPAKTENTMQTNGSVQTAEQLMSQALQLLAQGTSGNIDIESVTKIVKEEIAKANMPKVIEIEVKLPNGAETKVKGQHKEFDKLLRLVGAKVPVLLKGDAGSGKTYGSKVVAQTLGLDFRIFSFTNETSLGRVVGFMNANGGYVTTAVREMYENGGVLILDEFDAANPNVAMALNNLLEGDEYAFPDAQVKRHADFRYVACTNTYGQGANKKFSARNKMDDATMDRFGAIIEWGYDEDMERRLFGDTDATRAVFAIRKNANAMGLNGLITPRRTREVNKMVALGFSIKEAVTMAILNPHKRDVQKGLTEGVSL